MGGGVAAASPIPGDCGPFLSPRSLWLPLTRLSRQSCSRAMASALSYVSKFKSFLVLFFTPLLLLPLIVLMPAKVSCVSGQPRGPERPVLSSGDRTPGALSWIPGRAQLSWGRHTRELRVPEGRCPAKNPEEHGDPGAHRS